MNGGSTWAVGGSNVGFGISGVTGLLGGVTNVGDGGDEGAKELGAGNVTCSDGCVTGAGATNDWFSLGIIGATGDWFWLGHGREGVNGVNFLASKLLISIVLCSLNYTGCPKIEIGFRILDNFWFSCLFRG